MALTFPSSGPNQDSTRILKFLSEYSDEKFGLVFYRCCSYDNDERWQAFMTRMKGWAMDGLESEVDGIVLKEWLSFEVVEDPELVTTAKDDIRRRHREWVVASGEPVNHGPNTRHDYPIYIDQASLDSVLDGCEPGAMTPEEMTSPTSYVIMVDVAFRVPQATDEQKAHGLDPSDKGFPPVDGCKMENVGWIKVKPFDLIPRGYSCMMDYGWDGCYQRPPLFAYLD